MSHVMCHMSLSVTPVITDPVITPTVKPLLTKVTVAQSKSCSTAPVKGDLSSTKCYQCEFVARSSNGLKNTLETNIQFLKLMDAMMIQNLKKSWRKI